MENAYGISKETLQEEISHGRFKYDWGRSFSSENNFDLYITLFGNQGYRIATYYIKTEKIMLTCPNWYLPPDYIIREFIGICKEQVQNENKD